MRDYLTDLREYSLLCNLTLMLPRGPHDVKRLASDLFPQLCRAHDVERHCPKVLLITNNAIISGIVGLHGLH